MTPYFRVMSGAGKEGKAGPQRRKVMVLLGLSVLVFSVASYSHAAASPTASPGRAKSLELVGAYPPSTNASVFGVSVPGLPTNLGPLMAFGKLVGRSVKVVSYYQDFASGPNFNARAAAAIWRRGAVPMLAWQPENGTGPSLPNPPTPWPPLLAVPTML